jgi:leucyl-tRNA synthetase
MKKTGHAGLDEPFKGMFTQGMVVHETYKKGDGSFAAPAEVKIEVDGDKRRATLLTTGEAVEIGSIEKMSKSKRNTVDPDDIIATYGADTARWFMLSDSPPDRDVIWTEERVQGSSRFVQRLWRLVNDAGEIAKSAPAAKPDALGTVKQPSPDLAWAIKEAASVLVVLVSPMMPHLAEECWAALGHDTLVSQAAWPEVEPALLVEDTVTLPVQANGKKRAEITVSRTASNAEIEAAVLALDEVKKALDGRPPKKVVIVPNRIVNVVG